MKVGCAKEIKKQEYRVGMTPSNAAAYVAAGHEVYIEKDAGAGSGFSDEEYIAAGAVICQTAKEVWDISDLMIKVKDSDLETAMQAVRVFNMRGINLTIPHTVPLTEEVRRISGRCLSAITGEPAFTASPSFTSSLGTRPLKSVGFTATMSGTTVLMTSGAATPFTGMLRPFFKARLFDIINEVLCISKNTRRSYEKFANFAS